ncbi:ABC transporter ATP-binding protein [Neobacillus drentensis]|uniref:ABC transporter ATP-binding protein n=1 Tax=Neobacillus drentensis TaxID=220684 RepID=UPI0028564444|nr:ABC transporter ATP-binding protein [Neobacillus drentensis]MDR7238503.1 ATP-binding cassette subfamily B protein AbcA/BmrA [Neobacillus drentensis]
MTEVKEEKGWRQFVRLVQHTKPSKWFMGIALLLSVSTTLVGLMVPLFTKNLINDFTISSLSTGRIILLVSALIIQAVASGISIYLLNHIGQSVVAGIRDRLWKKLLVLPIPFYDENQTGETVSRMTNDTAVVRGLITDHLANFLSGTISIIGSIVVLLLLDWKMALLMFIALPLAAVILMTLGRRMHQVSKGMQTETARFTSVLQQVLSEIRLVKASNAEAIEYKSGKNGITQLFQYGLKEAKIQALITPLIGLVIMVLLVVILGYGGMRVSSGALKAGDLVAFIMYLFQIVMPMGQLAAFFTQFQKATGATERIITIMDMTEEQDDSMMDVNNVNQSIIVENLNYSYKNGDDILKDIWFSAEAGKVTAIVGPSGSGKTTLFSLLERYYQPQQGVIRLGNVPINQFSLFSWRSQIGYVSQESPIVVGTIRDNICYGMDKKVDQAAIERVAKMAFADQFIYELPNGYDTEVGERGIKLSGGQRQRIAIARAFLRDPKILMLDEATSSLDSKSEQVVQQALQNLMKGRTTLVIAHRLSTVIDSDQILFLDKGKITGSGTHEQLIGTHSLYREFAEQQLRINETV